MTSLQREYMKVVLLGDRMTGKTSLMKRYFLNQYNIGEQATIGAAFESKIFDIDGKEYQMGVWDTSGEERYQSVCKLYYRNATAAIVCYDVTLENTFRKLNYWINEVRQVEENCRIFMCATKSDLLQQFEANPKLSLAQDYARINGLKFFLTSSKTGENVETLFNEVLDDCISEYRDTPRRNTIRLPSNTRRWRQRTKNCCSKR
ncbi:ras-related protein Rab-24-like isoform X1 [Phymastichus coffea]|uniref:ras-related protein Rab-24-like isoform X1 n=1 Tax=Phymastichus coffea TaxID=108790 RepID=UPI00273BA914|nr:ras-related protein Rab-24-like isoform X1 [Phymastichus coffea]XP_058802873.1 ras-related protein Rab-24-like isoform X1 [Phymastichus coffea]